MAFLPLPVVTKSKTCTTWQVKCEKAGLPHVWCSCPCRSLEVNECKTTKCQMSYQCISWILPCLWCQPGTVTWQKLNHICSINDTYQNENNLHDTHENSWHDNHDVIVHTDSNEGNQYNIIMRQMKMICMKILMILFLPLASKACLAFSQASYLRWSRSKWYIISILSCIWSISIKNNK